MIAICNSCQQDIPENYCSKCGTPARLKRIDRHYIQHEIEHILHLEKGIFYTVKELVVQPGESINTFILNNRNRLVKPIVFIIVTSLIYTVTNHFFHIEEGYLNFDKTNTAGINPVNQWVQHHYGYANIIMGVFIACWQKLFFRKYGYNFFELLIVLCFVQGVGMLLFSLFAIAEGLSHAHLLHYGGMLFMGYHAWAVGQFFEKNKFVNYLKAVGAYLLGIITFSICVLLLGFLLHAIHH
ncbi:DUF3667 domain-containing protein [Taibaiella chishuiensis]|uniref:Uncharacterized protein DUF3667 n=1 Tax=Taibaiella chishuiensis TaxID=1434707 RepID=A0A2P8D1P6_9BACT|nr:DUF3667 domain-containing protein [Taibaiella chishuiensis]PSK91139.1 uncharacterized protein DUF3667 [Taibaiella chishuiensis]